MKPDLSLVHQVLSLPTAPFHEEGVALFIKMFCKGLRLKCLQDAFGNLKVIYKKGKTRPVCFTAHMDHPGFEVIRGGRRASVKLLGGVPEAYFLRAKVVLWDKNGKANGVVAKIISKKGRTYLVKTNHAVKKGAFGYFDLPGFKLKNGKIYTKAADNLISVACLLNLLKELVQKKPKAYAICLFTRAEEVGFVGAMGAMRNGFLSKKIPMVVLESSSAKAGRVKMGEGPVLRVGDRYSTFSPEMDLWLRTVADKLIKKRKEFRYQRALLPGGRCEASVYVTDGYWVGGVALPMANYHNQGPKNYAPEVISASDYKNLLSWLITLSRNPPTRSSLKELHNSVVKRFRAYAHRLRTYSKTHTHLRVHM